MKNKTKFILANLFALVAVLGLLSLYSALGINIKETSGSFVPQVALLCIPQLGFAFFYVKSLIAERNDALA